MARFKKQQYRPPLSNLSLFHNQGENMNKQIITAALAAGLALPAVAQQVTVYGIIDQAVRSTSPSNGSKVTETVSGSFLTSRIGFRGEEDLGGGLKASFVLEGALNNNKGAVGNGIDLFSRESSVTLSGAFGAVTMGRTDTSASEGMDTLAGIANFGNFGFVSGVEYAGDRENTVRYTTPNIGGLQAQIGRSHASAQGAELDSASITYSQGSLSFGAGYDRTQGGDYTAVAARYDFGFASAGVMVGQRDEASVKTDVMAITTRVPLVAGIAAHGAYRTSEVNNVKTTVSSVGISKALSKRTTLLAVYQDTDRGSAAGSFVQAGLVHSF
jgi:predicted porin